MKGMGAGASGSGSHAWASANGALASAAATAAAADWASGFAAGSGCAWSASGLSQTWPFLCSIFLSRRHHRQVSSDCSRTRGHGNRSSWFNVKAAVRWWWQRWQWSSFSSGRSSVIAYSAEMTKGMSLSDSLVSN